MPLTHVEIGAAVYAALTEAELAELTDGIRTARLSYEDEDDQGDDWLCIMMQQDVAPRGLTQRVRRVTKADLMLTCIDLAELMETSGRDWGRILNVFGDHSTRVEFLFTAASAGMIAARPAVLRRVSAAHAAVARYVA